MIIQSNKRDSFLTLIRKTIIFSIIAVLFFSGCSRPVKSGSHGLLLTSSNDFHPQFHEIEFELQLQQEMSGKEKILIEILDEVSGLGNNRQLSSAWWQALFENYSRFTINYTKAMQLSTIKRLIEGCNSVLPAFSGSFPPVGRESDPPEYSEVFWRELIINLQKIYKGDLLWATHARQKMDPNPEFIEMFDGSYLRVDSPFPGYPALNGNGIAYGYTNVIDNLIYEAYRSTEKPIILAADYPSVDKAVQGCWLVNPQCQNDGLFLNDEIADLNINLDEQYRIYASILPVIASSEWITGLAVRGYQPSIVEKDGSSSIARKPAANLNFQ